MPDEAPLRLEEMLKLLEDLPMWSGWRRSGIHDNYEVDVKLEGGGSESKVTLAIERAAPLGYILTATMQVDEEEVELGRVVSGPVGRTAKALRETYREAERSYDTMQNVRTNSGIRAVRDHFQRKTRGF